MHKEKTSRSIIKAVTYRILSIVLDSSIAYLITKDVGKTLLLVALTNTASILMYFIHERIWNKVNWGKKSEKTCAPGEII